MKAKISEIFRSIQGEGPYVGEEHIFVRFYGCNLLCGFCDERDKIFFEEYTVAETISEIFKERVQTVSLTGGEPLLQADFLKKLLPVLKEMGFRIYLETNGVLQARLSEVLDYIDIVSMDFKLPSSTGMKACWKEHTGFLKEARKKQAFVKIVVSGDTLLRDIKKAISIVEKVDRDTPFIIQPRSYNNGVEKIALLGEILHAAKHVLNDVRVIPQVHKVLGVK